MTGDPWLDLIIWGVCLPALATLIAGICLDAWERRR